MSVRRRFTEEEDRVIFSKISENPGNISQCLRELSTELDRSYLTLRYRWYSTISKRNNLAGVSFVTYGNGSANLNRKVTRKDTQQSIKTKKSKWRRILNILFE
jgi:hypothetical protein